MDCEIDIDVTLTASKIMAFGIVVVSATLDIVSMCISKEPTATCFMYSVPFVVALITGKQYLDAKKDEPVIRKE